MAKMAKIWKTNGKKPPQKIFFKIFKEQIAECGVAPGSEYESDRV